MKVSFLTFPVAIAISAAVLLAYATVYWSLLDSNVEIISASWFSGIRLMACGLALTYIGYATCLVATHRTRSLTFLSFPSLSPLARHITHLVIGQTLCVLWGLLRSGLSGVAYLSTGYQLPISRVEVILVLTLLITTALKTRSELHKRETPPLLRGSAGSASAWSFMAFVGLLALALLPIALRELPREIALSSDPDQHAFWTSQVLRLGGIPWDQGILGIGSFGYPAGFAVLSTTWCIFSGLSPVEIVTIQPILQFILAALLCGALAERCFTGQPHKEPGTSTLHTLIACCVLLTAYWAALPYGYQPNMNHGEGGARASASLFMAITLAGMVSLSGSLCSRAQRVIWLLSLVAVGVIIATINPITAIFPCSVVALAGLYELGRSAWAYRRPTTIAAGVVPVLSIGLGGLLLLLSDPYFTEMILSALSRRAGETAVVAGTQADPISLQFNLGSEPFLPWIMPSRLCAFLVGGTYPPEFFTAQLYVVIAALFLWWVISSRASSFRFALLWLYLGVSFYLSLGIPRGGDVHRPIYLIQPYVMQSIMQAGCVLGLLLLAMGALCVTRSLKGWGAIISLAAGVASIATPDASLATYNRYFDTKPRRAYCGSLGCVSDGDRAAIQFVRSYGTELLSKYSGLSYDDAPKILIPTNPADLGTERWLFPFGASRILPLESPLPVAFFYGRGSPQWTYDNYRRHVCSQFDIDWLRRRNVRFLFLPSSYSGCIRGKSRVIESSTILFEQEETKVLKLF